MMLAALDLGTNNCRLLIGVPCRPSGFRAVETYTAAVRLGEGLRSTRRLSQSAMARTVKVLHECRARLERYPITDCAFIATEACRSARNASAFLRSAAEHTGLHVRVIDAEEEAALLVRACMSLLVDHDGTTIVFDIGGGSTELIAVAPDAAGVPRMRDWVSYPEGVVTLRDRFRGATDPQRVHAQIVRETAAALAPFVTRNRDRSVPRLLGTSGTVLGAASLAAGMGRYRRGRLDGVSVEPDALQQTLEALRLRTPRNRYHDLMLPGSAVLAGIMQHYPGLPLRVAERGLREGLMHSMLDRQMMA